MVINSTLISAEFLLISPGEATQSEPFSVNLEKDGELTYDVKIFVQDDTKEFSEIQQDGTWKSPYKYLLEAYPASTEFTIRAHKPGETKICARLRETGKKDFEEACNPIVIIEKEIIPEETAAEEPRKKEEKETSYSPPKKETAQKSMPLQNLSFSKPPEPVNEPETIVLNSPKLESTKEPSETIVTKSGKLRNSLIYIFSGILGITVVLLVWRRL